ncbi:MAG: hypothetical protein SGPRY_010175, partial [Prymnesium sp.]
RHLSTVRVVHWNVRRCIDISGVSSLPRVLQTLESLQPLILTLNEVDIRCTPSLMQHLESKLGLPHASFFGHVRGTYGNLIASKVPLQNVMHIHLRGGSEVRLKDGGPHRIARGLLCADLSVFGVHLRVLLTHLDHMSTEERRTQMRHLLQSLRTLANGQQCLLIGDLNALSRCDLTSQEWVSHENYNLSMGWEPPIDESQAGGVLAMLRDAQFVDSYASLECPPDWRAPPWTAHSAFDSCKPLSDAKSSLCGVELPEGI